MCIVYIHIFSIAREVFFVMKNELSTHPTNMKYHTELEKCWQDKDIHSIGYDQYSQTKNNKQVNKFPEVHLKTKSLSQTISIPTTATG